MQRNIVLTSLCAIFFVCASAILFYIKQVEAHPNINHKTLVFERCWLLGYPNRTDCGSRTYIRTFIWYSLNDHNKKIINNVAFYWHKPGRQNHAVDKNWPPLRREYRVKTVLHSCDECSTF